MNLARDNEIPQIPCSIGGICQESERIPPNAERLACLQQVSLPTLLLLVYFLFTDSQLCLTR